MDRLQVGQLRREILGSPEQLNVVGQHVVAPVKKLSRRLGLARVQIVQIDPGRSTHHFDRAVAVGLDHQSHILPMIDKEIKN
jgi:hypothetical protein